MAGHDVLVKHSGPIRNRPSNPCRKSVVCATEHADGRGDVGGRINPPPTIARRAACPRGMATRQQMDDGPEAGDAGVGKASISKLRGERHRGFEKGRKGGRSR